MDQEMLDQIKEYLRELFNNPPNEVWPKEVTFADDFPVVKARVHKNGSIDIQSRHELKWVDVKFTIDEVRDE
jgi:hypothetical protein